MYALCSIDGEIADGSKGPLISVDNRAFLYGDGVFDTVPWRNGALHLWDRHIERLLGSVRLLGLIPQSARLIEEWALALIDAAGVESCMVRITSVPVSRGVLLPLSPALTQTVITLRPAPTLEAASRPISTTLSALPFYPPRTGARFKGMYAHVAMESRRLAMSGGGDRYGEILYADREGRLIEGGTSNLLAVVGGELLTPPLSCGVLPGITRGWVIEQARKAGMDVTEATLPSPAMLASLGARLYRTSSAVGIQPLAAVDDVALPYAPADDPLAAIRSVWWSEQ